MNRDFVLFLFLGVKVVAFSPPFRKEFFKSMVAEVSTFIEGAIGVILTYF